VLALQEEDLYHASVSSKHVKGEEIFHSLNRDERMGVERGNKTKNLGFKNRTLSYQLSLFSPKLGISRNEILLTEGEEVRFCDVVGRIAAHCKEGALLGMNHPIYRVFMVAHGSLAEMQTFKDFHNIKIAFDSVRGTYITMGASYEVCTYFKLYSYPVRYGLC